MLNNIDLTSDFIQFMHKELQTETRKAFAQCSPSEQGKLESCLSDFQGSAQTFGKLLKVCFYKASLLTSH